MVMRSGKNALETITAVKAKLAALKPSLPPGVERSCLSRPVRSILRAVDHLRH